MRVGVSSVSPSEAPSSGTAAFRSRRSTSKTLRTSENPLECRPDEGRAIRTSPARTRLRSSISERSATPTAKPARSYSSGA